MSSDFVDVRRRWKRRAIMLSAGLLAALGAGTVVFVCVPRVLDDFDRTE